MDLYQILEIKSTASEIEIKKAYHKLVKKYHPDKCKESNATEKFQKIQSAYDILINPKTRQEYMRMTQPSQTEFVNILDKIIAETLDINELKHYGINLEKIDFEYIAKNCINFFKAINAGELLNFFKQGIVPKKNLDNIINCSESELEVYDETCAEYYYNLPISLQKNDPLDIKLDINIQLTDIINKNKKKIKIKRKVGDMFETSTFILTLSHPYIIYYGAGDNNNINTGNLIIRLLLPKNLLWLEDIILVEQSISLYELIYGLNICLDLGEEKIRFQDWVPSRDGFMIDIVNKFNINLAIKLCLNYEDNVEKEQILKQFFS